MVGRSLRVRHSPGDVGLSRNGRRTVLDTSDLAATEETSRQDAKIQSLC
jgi:hypothetical protein